MSTESRRNLLLGLASAAGVALAQDSSHGSGEGDGTPRKPLTFTPTTPSKEDLRVMLHGLDTLQEEIGKIAVDKGITKDAGLEQLKRPPSNPTELTRVRQNVNHYYRIDRGTLSAAWQRQVDYDFVFSPAPSDRMFRYQNVELLLNGSADLLERALGQVAEWYELASKAFNVQQELQQFFDIDALHTSEEIPLGYYTHQAEEVALLVTGEAMSADASSKQSQQLNDLVQNQFSQGVINHLDQEAQILAEINSIGNYGREEEGTTEIWVVCPEGGAEKKKLCARTATSLVDLHSLNVQAAVLTSQGIAAAAAQHAMQGRADGDTRRRQWEGANAGFQYKRYEIARQVAIQKSNEYSSPGGALNYPERMDSLKLRISRDFREALARANVASDGLRLLFGYSNPIPSSVRSVLSGQPATAGVFESCLVWVRDAIEFLTALKQSDQTCSLPISLKGLLGADNFRAGLAHSAAQWAFGVDQTLFPGQLNVRLRGITIYVVGPTDQLKGVWSGSLTAPEDSFCNVITPEGVTKSTLHQSNVTVFGGRISYRENQRQPDILGASVLANVSPFKGDPNGMWTLTLATHSTEGFESAKLNDVVVEFHVATQQRQA